MLLLTGLLLLLGLWGVSWDLGLQSWPETVVEGLGAGQWVLAHLAVGSPVSLGLLVLLGGQRFCGGVVCWREKGLEVPQLLFQGRNRQVMSLSSLYQVGISVGRCLSACPPLTLPTGGCNCS